MILTYLVTLKGQLILEHGWSLNGLDWSSGQTLAGIRVSAGSSSKSRSCEVSVTRCWSGATQLPTESSGNSERLTNESDGERRTKSSSSKGDRWTKLRENHDARLKILKDRVSWSTDQLTSRVQCMGVAISQRIHMHTKLMLLYETYTQRLLP